MTVMLEPNPNELMVRAISRAAGDDAATLITTLGRDRSRVAG